MLNYIFASDSVALPQFSGILINIPSLHRGGRAMSDSIHAGDTGITTEPMEDVEIKTRRIPPFNVILENDDHHSMEFVISVLLKALVYNEQRCFQLMMQAHTAGQAVVWTGSKEVAELKLEQMLSFHEIQPSGKKLGPLGVRIEPAPG
jgi:ATP-dependent Clp protease adaptor protein ClpS